MYILFFYISTLLSMSTETALLCFVTSLAKQAWCLMLIAKKTSSQTSMHLILRLITVRCDINYVHAKGSCKYKKLRTCNGNIREVILFLRKTRKNILKNQVDGYFIFVNRNREYPS